MYKFSALSIAASLFFALSLTNIASAVTYVRFDIPGANGAGTVYGVNNWGSATGIYRPSDSPDGWGGFIYQAGGVVTTFSVPGQTITYPLGINDAGWIVGYYSGDDGVLHGFLRDPNYRTLDVPEAGTGVGQGTAATHINDSGEIAGVYYDSNSVEHSFLWSASGGFTTFDAIAGADTTVVNINAGGDIAGNSYVPSDDNHSYGYVRDSTGNITTFDVPGDVFGTFVSGINASGQIAGSYFPGSTPRDYIRDQYGNFTIFTLSGTQGPIGIQDNGNVVGFKVSNSNQYYGWNRSAAGVLTYFTDPIAGPQGTYPECISSNGKVSGIYYDSQGSPHNFLMY